MQTLTRLAVTLIAGVFMAIMLSGGVEYSYDGEAYMGAARAIREEGGIPRDWVYYSPLHPILLALFPPASMETGAAVINIAAFSLSAGLMASLFPVTRRVFVVLVLLIASTALRSVHSYALSEPVFITLVLLFVAGVQRRSWTIMMVAAALAGLQRYAGVMLIPAGVVALWLMHKPRAILLFAIGAFAPAALWMVRNFFLVGAPMGVRLASDIPLSVNIEATLATLLEWLPLLIVAWLAVPPAALSRSARAALVIYGVGYVALIVWSASTTAIDLPGDRLLAPVFPALVLLAAGLPVYQVPKPIARTN